MLQAKPFLIKKAWPSEGIAAGQVVMVRPIHRALTGQLIIIRYQRKPWIVRLVKRSKARIVVRGGSGKETTIPRGQYEIAGKVLRGSYQTAAILLVSKFITRDGRLVLHTGKGGA
jgi:hypothetical protein